MTAADVDVAVAGGGPVGAALALAIADSGLAVALLDPALGAAPAPPHDDERSTALAPASRRVLTALGVWEAIAPGAEAIRSIHVSEQGRFGRVGLREPARDGGPLGHVVPNRVLNGALHAALRERSGTVDRVSAGVRQVVAEPEAARLLLDDGRVLRARLLVAADGARSRLRTALGIGTRDHDYGQTAVVANVTPARGHQGQAFERFTPDGPLALLPLPAGRCAVVWAVAPERAASLVACREDAFLEALQAAFGYRLGRLTRGGVREAYPVRLTRARSRTAHRALLLGNAATSLHPVAGQGFNLALRDVADLAERLHGAGRSGADPGARAWLDGHVAARAGDHRRMAAFTSALVVGFSNRLPGLSLARSAGLAALDMVPGARGAFIGGVTAPLGRPPRLLRGLLPDGRAHGAPED